MPMPILPFLLQDPASTSGAAPQTPGTGPTGPEATQSGGAITNIVMIVGMIAIFYFVMILPERKARKKREAMLSAMKKGDRVMTSSGMYATIASIDADEITLQIADGVRAKFSRQAITQVLDDSSAETKK